MVLLFLLNFKFQILKIYQRFILLQQDYYFLIDLCKYLKTSLNLLFNFNLKII